jgi:PDZ domain
MRSAGVSFSRTIGRWFAGTVAALAVLAAIPALAQTGSAAAGSAAPTADAAPVPAATTGRIAEVPRAVASPAAAAPDTVLPTAVVPDSADDASDADLPAPDPAETPIAVLPPNLLPSVTPASAQGPSTAEIPQAPQSAASPSPSSAGQPVPGTLDNAQDYTNPEIADYERAQEGISDPAQMQSLRAFMAEGAISSPIGMEMREARRRLASGEVADGLLVLKVDQGSPAALAGLRGYHQVMHNALTGAAIAAAMIFPPAILVVPVLVDAQIGESYDMIIGVDGNRVTNFLDFEDRMREVRGGELVYFSIVRDGHRKQITVKVPRDMANLAW